MNCTKTSEKRDGQLLYKWDTYCFNITVISDINNGNHRVSIHGLLCGALDINEMTSYIDLLHEAKNFAIKIFGKSSLKELG